MANPTLTSANVTFHTNDDDKDYNTSVTVNVLLRDGETRVASTGGLFANFGNNSDAGPFALLMWVNPVTRDELKTGSVLIHIAPSGNDTWRFNFLLDLVFSDGAHLIARANGIELTQDSTTQSFGIE